ncbi:putative bifunctional diguanylate cyclase/phosphodiesterase [Bacterioplanes sanyensis]|uniref:putative bifunctional diguanylate cyclase/phosphodiesterase n=1 Tax=Bacterioplanes sanyensis TaxID=1249553 RepID=UPI001E552DC1|nr:GGDEF domain-containing phosphodiesterase [Bacterioplanes sanyensis]
MFQELDLHLAPTQHRLEQFHQHIDQALLESGQTLTPYQSDQLNAALLRTLTDSSLPFDYLAVYRPSGRRVAQAASLGQAGDAPASLKEIDLNFLKQHAGSVLGGNYSIADQPHLAICRHQIWQRNHGYLCAFSANYPTVADGISDTNRQSLEFELIRADGVLLIASSGRLAQHQLLQGELVAISLRQAVERSIEQSPMRLPPEANPLSNNYYYLLQFIPGLNASMILEVPQHRATTSYLRYTLPLIAGWLVLLGTLGALLRWQRDWLQGHQQQQQAIRQRNKLLEDETALLTRTLHGCVYRVRLPSLELLHITHDQNSVLGRELQLRLERHNSLLSLIASEDQETYLTQLEQHKDTQQPYEIVYRMNSSEQELRWILDRGCVQARGENQYEAEGFLVDITDQTLSQQHIHYLATRDPLTELGNRYWFNDELISYTRHQSNRQRLMALLFIDLDRFKTINDSLGHQFGDQLLCEVAQRLRRLIPEHYPVARLGGDEFMIMMTDGRNRADIERLAQRLIKALGDIYRIEQFKLTTTCSIGISLFPQDSSEAFVLMRNADTAMYQAKSQGGNTFQFYTDEMNQRVNSRLTLENELRRAIQAQEFELYYQPQVCTHTNRLLGAEALIRWCHPDAGIISPADFIPVAEDTGLITEIGDWALYEACSTFRRWNQQLNQPLTISVNVSVRQLCDSFVLRVRDILQQTGLPAEQLELEITESLLMDNVQQNIEWLTSIHAHGISFAMDDFGTGYSSLSYLKQFPISKLKIDRAFIMDITQDADDEAIVRAILAMSHTLRLKVVAEGVETTEQLQLLQQLSCDSYQGYFFSRPVDKHTFEQQFLSYPESATHG